MDDVDREINMILSRVFEHVLEDGRDDRERRGSIRRSTFCLAASQLPIRCRDPRSQDRIWQLAHDRGYLTHCRIEPDYNAPVIMFSGDRTIDWTRSTVRPDIWARGGELQEPIDQLAYMLSGTTEAITEMIR